MSACSKQTAQSTVIELQFISAEEALPLITPTIPEDVEHQQAGNRIVFYTDASQIKATLNLLETLDAPPIQYLVEFRQPRKPNTISYSTRKQSDLPISSFQVMEGKTASINTTETIFYPFFDGPVTLDINQSTIKIRKRDDLTSELSLLLQGTVKGKQQRFESSWALPNNRWTAISPKPISKNKSYSTRKRSPLDVEVRISPVSNGF